MKESPISDLAAHCIRCGFCLESCPTFLITGKETESPRGRIYLIRSADAGLMEWDDPSVRGHVETCVGCRNCETACPSGVRYGEILEMARERFERESPSKAKAVMLGGITRPSLLRLQLALAKLFPGKLLPRFVSGMVAREPAQAEKPRPQPCRHWPALAEDSLPPVKGTVRMLQGCAMEVLFPNVNEATRRLLRRVGYQVVDAEGCCGALHAHNGYLEKGRRMAKKLLGSDGKAPLVVNSAGCGSFLKDLHLGAVLDISEFVIEHGLQDRLRSSEFMAAVTYHDACHLAHGQKIAAQPRQLLKSIPGLELRELPECDLCCGSGGIYNLLQPGLAREMLERKWANIESTGARFVVTGNPGCHAWIDQRSGEAGGRVRVLHTVELLEMALSDMPPPGGEHP